MHIEPTNGKVALARDEADLRSELDHARARAAALENEIAQERTARAELVERLADWRTRHDRLQTRMQRSRVIRSMRTTLKERQDEVDSLRRATVRQAEHAAALNQRVIDQEIQIRNLGSILQTIHRSKAWFALSVFRRIKQALRAPMRALHEIRLQGIRIYLPGIPLTVSDYAAWLATHDPAPTSTEVQADLKALVRQPLISVLMPTYNTPANVLEAAIESVCQQHYPNWELCIVDDGSTQPGLRHSLDSWAKQDARIRVEFRTENGGISVASAAALALAQGEYVALLDHDDVLPRHALLEVVKAIDADPALDMLYTDEDKLDLNGARCEPFFKPDWSPETFLSYMYTAHLGVYRTDLVRKVGGFRKGFDGSQDYDLVLRLTSQPIRIHHIPKILYHWRKSAQSTALDGGNKSYAEQSARRAIGEALKSRGVDFEGIEAGRLATTYRIRYRVPKDAAVGIIIPSRNNQQYLRRCLDSVLTGTAYENFRIHIVDNGSDDPATLDYLKRIEGQRQVRVHRYAKPFNYSAINNWAVAQTGEPYLLLLNDDTEVINRDWLEAMMEHAARPAVGAVGAKLYYSDGRIQHAGVITGLGGVAGHSHKYFPRQDPG